MTQEEKDLQFRCSQATEHMQELMALLPRMQEENTRLQQAENAAAVQVYEKHYLVLKNHVAHLYEKQKESIAKCRDMHETIADPAILAEEIRKEGDRQADITNLIAHNEGTAYNKRNEYGNFMLRYFSGEAEYHAALLSEEELATLRARVLSYRDDYQETLKKCQELDGILSEKEI